MSSTLAEKDPDQSLEYGIDARIGVTSKALRAHPYGLAAVVRSSQKHTGFYYVCTTAGETSQAHPSKPWPRADGQTLVDGSVVWTCRHPSSAALPAISSVSWETGDLTLVSQRTADGIAYVTLSGGVHGIDYEVTASITWATSPAVTTDVTVTIPVRNQ